MPIEKIEKTEKAEKAVSPVVEETIETSAPAASTKEFKCTFNKALTEREQAVFDYFAQNVGSIVYAKDLANLLELPRDYVYKYIKNLRSKIDGDKLKNSDNGGYILTM